MLRAPQAFEVVIEETANASAEVRIHRRIAVGDDDVLPRTEACIKMTGTGRFILRLDGVMSLEEIYDHNDDGVLEILSEFCAIAEAYLGGAGTITSQATRRGARRLSVAISVGEDQYLLESRSPRSGVLRTC
jgi:hypothetical protein